MEKIKNLDAEIKRLTKTVPEIFQDEITERISCYGKEFVYYDWWNWIEKLNRRLNNY